MAGVIPNSMERAKSMDIDRMAHRIAGIFFTTSIHSHCHQRRDLDGHRNDSGVEHLAEKSMGSETAPRGIRRLHRLVLERAAHLAKSASKLDIRCYSKSGCTWLYLIHYKIIVERGV